ncbi:hypothetical protein HanRHA438_Chr00c34g0855521 [Helianthus annuus]|nr:hypothetical protein HanRHA438_Chr00c34g0855521 [Helianthus annuus]
MGSSGAHLRFQKSTVSLGVRSLTRFLLWMPLGIGVCRSETRAARAAVYTKK